MVSIWKRILIQMKNDKRSLGLIMVAPILVLTMLYFILGDSDYIPKISAYNMPDGYINLLTDDSDLTILTDLPDTKTYCEEQKQDALIWKDNNGIHLMLLKRNAKSSAALKLIQEANQKLNPNVQAMDLSYVYETNTDNQLDSLSYVFLGVLSFFFVFIISGMSFVRERFSQTLERTLMTPVSRFEVIGGYTLGYGVISAIQSIVIILFTVYILKIQVNGSVFLCMVIMILMAFLAVSMGALFSIFANNELQMVQFIPIVLIPQIFYSGLISLDTIPLGLGKLCFFFPIYYASGALEKVMIEGKGLGDITNYVLGLLIYIGFLYGINVLALKKYRKL